MSFCILSYHISFSFVAYPNNVGLILEYLWYKNPVLSCYYWMRTPSKAFLHTNLADLMMIKSETWYLTLRSLISLFLFISLSISASDQCSRWDPGCPGRCTGKCSISLLTSGNPISFHQVPSLLFLRTPKSMTFHSESMYNNTAWLRPLLWLWMLHSGRQIWTNFSQSHLYE